MGGLLFGRDVPSLRGLLSWCQTAVVAFGGFELPRLTQDVFLLADTGNHVLRRLHWPPGMPARLTTLSARFVAPSRKATYKGHRPFRSGV
eukprot:5080331-Amphidinium_carterae.1